MISALFILNVKGDIVMWRNFRGDVKRSVATAFKLHVLHGSDAVPRPIVQLGSAMLFFKRHESLYVLAVSRANADAALVFEAMGQTVAIFEKYFGTFDEATIRNNFVLSYELLDEILDFGYPQITQVEMLQLYIMNEQGKKKAKAADSAEEAVTIQATGQMSWRRQGIKYKHNEVYIDITESVNVLLNTQGQALRSEVNGQIVMKCFLSGMPECKFGLNDRIVVENERGRSTRASTAPSIDIDDYQFHQCVRLGKFESDRTITFVPPDKEFELMRYRTTESIRHPFRLLPIVKEHGRTRVEAKINVKSLFGGKIHADNVLIKLPVPKNTASAKISCGTGKAKYEPEHSAIVWRIKRFPGDAEYTMSAEVELVATTSLEKKVWSRPPISMEFQVPQFTASNLHVRFMKLHERKLSQQPEGYKSKKWVRYVTKAGSYQYRI